MQRGSHKALPTKGLSFFFIATLHSFLLSQFPIFSDFQLTYIRLSDRNITFLLGISNVISMNGLVPLFNSQLFTWLRKMNERRENIRYILKDGCIVIHDNTVGAIHDISASGLSCCCLNDECDQWLGNKIDILCRQHNILAEEIHIKILETECLPGEFLKGLKTRKCRVIFEPLNKRQIGKLENILTSYACAGD